MGAFPSDLPASFVPALRGDFFVIGKRQTHQSQKDLTKTSEPKGFSTGWSTPAIMSSFRGRVIGCDSDRWRCPRRAPKDAWMDNGTDRPPREFHGGGPTV
jgi:hypothetical protein